jgi:hypothetical protein
MVGRTFALVELVRSEADFLFAPVLIEVAQVWSGGSELTATGIHYAIWATVIIAIILTVLMGGVFMSGGARLEVPDLENWLKGDDPGLESPPLFALFRDNPKKPAEQG